MKSKMYRILLTLFLAFTMLAAGSYAHAQGGTWETKTDMPTARYHIASGVVNGKIYVIGGWNGSSNLNTVEEYDPATDTWETKTAMSNRRNGNATSVVNGKIYATGGYNFTINADSNTVEEYDPATDTWETKAAMLTGRSYHTSSVVNGKIYVIGGRGAFNSVEEYDPATDIWETKAAMPTARHHHASSVVNGKIYVIGGTPASASNTVEEYDPATDTWETKAAMPTGRYGAATSVVNGKIYATGGYNFTINVDSNTVEEYDPANDTWTNCGGTCASMPSARSFHTSSVVNGKIYAIGGRLDPTPLNTVEEYTPPSSGGTSNTPPVADAGEDQTIIFGDPVTLDGSASDDEDGEIVSFDWDFDDRYGDSGETVDYTYESAGEYIVTLTVTDDDGATGEDTVTITVLTPEEAAADLISDIEGLGLHRGIENSLISKLKAAIKAFEKGKDKTATNILNAFINAVEAQRGKKISDKDADFLIDTALWIIG